MSEDNVKDKETNSGLAENDMERTVIERAIHDNVDFIGYIDVKSGKIRILRHNDTFFNDDMELTSSMSICWMKTRVFAIKCCSLPISWTL